MGRNKIKIHKITNDRIRQVSILGFIQGDSI